MNYHTSYDSPVGKLLISGDGETITGLWLAGQKYFPETAGDYGNFYPAVFDTAKRWLDDYFGGGRPSITELPLAPEGSAFRKAVWDALCEIPYGETLTYGEIAARLSAKTGGRVSARAVGGAAGHNPISIIIPCHRLIGKNGALTGYAGGIERKRYLLAHERAR